MIKRILFLFLLFSLAVPARAQYLGDFAEDETIYFTFDTYDSDGGSVAATTSGTVSVYKDNGTTQSTAGVTYTIAFDSLTGVYSVTIDTSADAFYATGAEYDVRLSSATIDSQVVHAVLRSFSIENRYMRGTDAALLAANYVTERGTNDAALATSMTAFQDSVLTIEEIVSDGSLATTSTVTDAHALTDADIALLQTDLDTLTAGVNVTAISGDTGAADNVAATYNGTGYADPKAPFTQAAGGSIGSSAGSATNSPTTYALTLGVQASGTYLSTWELDGVYNQHTDAVGAMDFYYEFNLPANGIPNNVVFTGRLNNQTNSLPLYAYDWINTDWDQIGTYDGQATVTDVVRDFTLFPRNVGDNGNAGKVRVRFYEPSALSTANLYIDQAFVTYSVIGSATGYANGSIWIDSLFGTAGAVRDVNGVADFPVDNVTDALALSVSTGLRRFQIGSGSTVDLIANASGMVGVGENWYLGLEGQLITGGFVSGAIVNGSANAASTSSTFSNSHFGATVGATPGTAKKCGLQGVLTLLATGTYVLDECYSEIAGTGSPTLDFGASIGTTNVSFRHYSGGIEILNMGASGTDTMTLEGEGQLIIAASCVSGTVAIRGEFTVTDNSGGALTLVDDARFDNRSDIVSILADTALIGTPVALDGGAATIAGNLSKLADDNDGADYDAETDSATELRDSLSTRDDLTSATWNYGTRTLTSYGTLVADVATAVWGAVTRTLTAGTKDTEIDAILVDTGTTLPAQIQVAQDDLDLLTGADGATLATSQPNYAPSIAGDEMDLVDAPNATALTAVGAAVWASGTRTLTSFGTLVADTATAVWGAVTRTLTAGTKDAEIDNILVIANKTDDTLINNGGVFELTTASLANSPAGGTGTTPAQVWAYTTRTTTGVYVAGLNTWTCTVKVSGVPVEGATVWATTSTAVGEDQPNPYDPANVLYAITTDDSGDAIVFLSDGTFNIYVLLPEADFPTSPQRITLP